MIYIIGPLNPAAFFSIAIITAQLDFKLKALPVNRCLTYLVVYTKLNSVGHIFHGGHSHESTGLTRSNNSIPRSINLLLKSFFIFWFKDDPSCKNSLQWGKIRHSYQAARRNLFARSGRGINQALQVSTQSPVMTRSEIGSLSKGVFERRTSTGSEVFFILKHLDAPKFVFLSVLTIIETSCPKRWAKPLSKNEKRPLPVDARRSKTSLLNFINIARRRVRARGRWQHWPHQTLTPDELGKRERERERERFSLLWL